MHKKLFMGILIGSLAVIAAFGIFRHFFGFQGKEELSRTLSETKEQLVFLEGDKEKLMQRLQNLKRSQDETLQRNIALSEELKAAGEKMAKLSSDLGEVQNTRLDLTLKYAQLKAENKVLREKRQRLFQESQSMRLKLSSVIELKKAIRELKVKMRRAREEITKRAEELSSIEGNRGFVIREGKSTYPLKIRIEVIPAGINFR